MEYLLHLSIIICFYSMLAQSLNLLAGFSGLISLSHAGFYGLGAYFAAILSINLNIPFILELGLAILGTTLIAYILSLTAIKMVDDYFILYTLSVQAILYSLFNNLSSVTNGPIGLKNIPPVFIFSAKQYQKLEYFVISLFVFLVIWFFIRQITRYGFGKTLQAISEDEIYSASIGKDVSKTKINAFTLSAALAAIPGVLFAHYISYINPTSFTVNESVLILAIVIVGGFRNLFGSVLASSFLILLPEYLRFLGLPISTAANLRQILYGVILILIVQSGKNGMGSLFKKSSIVNKTKL